MNLQGGTSVARFIKKVKALCLLITVACLLLIPFADGGEAAAEKGIRVKINDKFLSLPQSPTNVGTSTLLPFRPIYEFLGATISWNQKTSTASASRGAIKVVLQVKDGIAKINDERVILNVSPRIVNGTTMVPAWFFAESLGAEVDWDGEQQVLNISLASVSGIALETRELTLQPGETETVAATVFPDNAVNKNIEWSSSLPSVAGVQKAGDTEAVISANSPGTAIIAATTEEGNYVSTCKVRVEEEFTPVNGISLNRSQLTLVEGSSPGILYVEITPQSATNKNITWKSSDSGTAAVHKQTVNNCIVVPLKEGNAIISATTEDGEFVDVCRVTVGPPYGQ